MEHDGHVIGDSQLIIRYLENTFNVSKLSEQYFQPFEKLTPSQKAQSDLIRVLCEQDLYWGIVSTKWGGKGGIGRTETCWHNTVISYFSGIPAAMRGVITSMVRVAVLRDAWGQGLVRHSVDDQLWLMKRSVEALSGALGSQKYMLGEAPTECDCIAFGTVDCLLDDSKWPNDLTDFVKRSCPNLVQYHRHIRQSVFADMKTGDRFPSGAQTTGSK